MKILLAVVIYLFLGLTVGRLPDIIMYCILDKRKKKNETTYAEATNDLMNQMMSIVPDPKRLAFWGSILGLLIWPVGIVKGTMMIVERYKSNSELYSTAALYRKEDTDEHQGSCDESNQVGGSLSEPGYSGCDDGRGACDRKSENE